MAREVTKSAPFKVDPEKLRELGKLQKGDILPVDECEKICPSDRHLARFGLELMALAKYIHDAIIADRDEEVIVRCRDKGLVVLTDQESVAYLGERVDAGLDCISRASTRVKRACSVEKLNESQRQRLYDEQRFAAAILSEAEKARAPQLK